MSHTEPAVGFLGDSITLGWGLDGDDRNLRFSTLVCRELCAREVNLGITGTLIARAGLSRDNRSSFVDRVGGLEGCDYAVIFGGTNDYFWSDAPIYPPADVSGEHFDGDKYFANDEYFATAADTVVREAARLVGGIDRLLVLTPYRHHGTGNYKGGKHFRDSSAHPTDTENFNGFTISDYSEALREVCRRHRAACLDLDSLPFDWLTLTSDGCHPNPAGHRRLARLVTERLGEIIKD